MKNWVMSIAAFLAMLGPSFLPPQTTGTAVHQNTLTWSAPTMPAGITITGYNVYRASGACPTGSVPSLAKINTAPVTQTSYVDTNVTAGASFCYGVTVVPSAGLESPPSGAGLITLTTPVFQAATPSPSSLSGSST